MKKFRLVIPISLFVAFLALWMLAKEYAEIDLGIRIIIAVGAAILSGGISFLLFSLDKEDRK
ncbi:histidine kinase [Pseudoneobacillus sp. C159]